jgi:hypothetical protein
MDLQLKKDNKTKTITWREPREDGEFDSYEITVTSTRVFYSRYDPFGFVTEKSEGELEKFERIKDDTKRTIK